MNLTAESTSLNLIKATPFEIPNQEIRQNWEGREIETGMLITDKTYIFCGEAKGFNCFLNLQNNK